jgi:thioredoxin 1
MSDTTQQATKQGATHLSAADFDQTIKGAGKPVFIDFYAEWCGPCQAAAPIVDRLAGEYADRVMITKLDVDDNREIAQKFGVMSIPTVLILKQDGEKVVEVDRKVGFPGEAGYRQMLDKAAPVTK